jgi:hypothetical protein
MIHMGRKRRMEKALFLLQVTVGNKIKKGMMS